MMSTPEEPEGERMMELAASGDRSAALDLLDQHRSRLKKMVAVRIDP